MNLSWQLIGIPENSVIEFNLYRSEPGELDGAAMFTTVGPSIRTYKDTSVHLGEVLMYDIGGVDGSGNHYYGESRTVVVGAGVPSAPLNLTATVRNGAVDVKFLAPSFQGGSIVDNFTVLIGPSADNISAAKVVPCSDHRYSYLRHSVPFNVRVNSLTIGATYFISVLATNSFGNGSATEPIAVTLNYAPVFKVTYTTPDPDGDHITFSWTIADDEGVLGYRIYQDGVLIAKTDASNLSATAWVKETYPGVFEVAAVYASGVAYSEPTQLAIWPSCGGTGSDIWLELVIVSPFIVVIVAFFAIALIRSRKKKRFD